MKPDANLRNISGIYQIRNLINNKVYVGRAGCLFSRCRQYVYAFNGKLTGHTNEYLTRSMIKHGFYNFVFEVIERCEKEKTPEKELFWILNKRSNEKNIGYNLRLDVEGKMIADDRTKVKISENLKEQWKNGSRSGHSDKLKKSWNKRDRKAQSCLMRKYITKYEYVVHYDGDSWSYSYAEILVSPIKGAFYKLCRNKIDSVEFKGGFVEKRRLCEKI
jgi:group I intron endonuclease